MIGTILSRYMILDKLGAGSVGELYHAQGIVDGKDFEIEVLPDSGTEAEGLADLNRQIRIFTSLDHPNLGRVFGFEDAEGKRFIVREFLPGETLAERMTRGGLGQTEALEITFFIAKGLETLHENNVIHGRLSPNNVQLTPDGRVKLTRIERFSAGASESDRDSCGVNGAATKPVAPNYLSPEQIRGDAPDKRSDIWAFGCLIHEMLSSKKAFPEATAVTDREPDRHLLPRGTPAIILDLLHRCLRKDRNRRLRDVGDARIEIEDVLNRRANPASRLFKTVDTGASSGWRQKIGWSMLGATVAALLFVALIWIRPSTPSPPFMRFTINLPESAPLTDRAVPLALSPDGGRLVYVAQEGAGTQLYLRGMDQLEASPIGGTEGAHSPFFSPDGDWVGYFDSRESKLKKIFLEGGEPVVLCDVQFGLGATWGSDNTIIFAPNVFSGLWRISVSGGTPEPLTQLEESEFTHRWPEILPGGKAVIFTAGVAGVMNHMRTILFSLETGESKILLEWGNNARYSPSGHLVFYRAGDLMAVPFDMRRLETQGTPATILEGVRTDRFLGSAHFALSSIGSLAYVPSGSDEELRSLVWVDRERNMQRLTVNRGVFSYPRLSPDGQQLAVVIYSEREKSDIWIVDVDTGAFRRLTSEGNNILPVWTTDGQRVTFSSDRTGHWSLFWALSDGTGPAERLAETRHPQIPSSWSPDGRFLAYTEFHPSTGADIWILPRTGNRNASPFLRTKSGEWGGVFSPDGRWLAYTSDETGPDQIFIKPYPGPGEAQQISTAEGREPIWGPRGDELFYRYWRRLMAVTLQTEPDFVADAPRVVHEGDFHESEDPLFHNYDISPDGSRFVVIHGERTPNPTIQIDLNCGEHLKRLSPPD